MDDEEQMLHLVRVTFAQKPVEVERLRERLKTKGVFLLQVSPSWNAILEDHLKETYQQLVKDYDLITGVPARDDPQHGPAGPTAGASLADAPFQNKALDEVIQAVIPVYTTALQEASRLTLWVTSKRLAKGTEENDGVRRLHQTLQEFSHLVHGFMNTLGAAQNRRFQLTSKTWQRPETLHQLKRAVRANDNSILALSNVALREISHQYALVYGLFRANLRHFVVQQRK